MLDFLNRLVSNPVALIIVLAVVSVPLAEVLGRCSGRAVARWKSRRAER